MCIQEGEEIRTVVSSHFSVPFLLHNVPSSGLLYTDVVISLANLNLDDIYYLPLLTRMMLEAGTTHLAAEALLPLMGRATGGMNASFAFKEKTNDPMTVPHPYEATGVLMISAKVI